MEMDYHLRIKDIIQKLKNLDCPLLGSGEDAWVIEILFKPNFDRYHLMEWIFSKLGFNIPKGDGCQNSSEVKVRNLLAAISALGLCGRNRSDIIQGTASLYDQLNLWQLLVDILWKKSSYTSSISEAGASSNSKELPCLLEQCATQNNYVNRLCESVNFNHLFKEKVQLFPAYLMKESKEASLLPRSGIESQKEIKTLALKNSNKADLKLPFRKNSFVESECPVQCNVSIIPNEDSLNKLEDSICSSVIDLHKHSSTDFNDAFQNLKLYLNVPSDGSVDVGPAFQTATSGLNSFLQLKNALSTLKSSEAELKTLNSDLQNFRVPCEPLPDSLLRECNTILRESTNEPME